MTSNYRRGAEAEYRVMREARTAGGVALRTRGSKGVADLVVVVGPRVWAVNVKRGGWPDPDERATFRDAWARTKVVPIMALYRPRLPLAWRSFTRQGLVYELDGPPWA